MFRVTIRCKVEYLRRETRYLITGTDNAEEARTRAIYRWNEDEKIHVDCEPVVSEILPLANNITACWKLNN